MSTIDSRSVAMSITRPERRRTEGSGGGCGFIVEIEYDPIYSASCVDHE